MTENPLQKLHSFGQSIWLDYLRRGMLVSGELQQLIDQDALMGMTSNPSIFERAIGGSHDYDDAIAALALEDKSVQEIYQTLTVEDVQRAADIFRPVYDRTAGRDGFVSLEVSPHLAHATEGTIAEARRLWQALARPNVLIKVPATLEGLPAIQQLISEGINVNITLLFGLPRYRKVVEAYLTGLEKRAAQGQPIEDIASVASFFLSRIDVLVDPLLEKKMKGDAAEARLAARLHGQVAIASAKVAYQIFQEILADKRFQKLASQGARPQRLLWASTSTKNPSYSDVKYVEALIGPQTVNTVPQETLNAYRDHGRPALRLEDGLQEADEVLDRLSELGIDIDDVTQQLEDEGVEKFIKPFDRLMATLAQERAAALEQPPDRQILEMGKYGPAVQARIDSLEEDGVSARLWRKDPSLWKDDFQAQEVIRNALGWLHVAEKMEENLAEIESFAADVKSAGFQHVVHIGMGGSSLTPLVFERTFIPDDNSLPLTVLDTTDPGTILRIERQVPLANTLFIVASKSGTTAEPLALADYFYARVHEKKGDRAGENFVAITDPGAPLIDLAQKRGFRRVFLNFSDIGGRYSALSYFGLVPAALMGVDMGELLARALRMVHACASCVPANDNPGLTLGAALGELGRQGRNKVTFLVPKAVATLGTWLEQLLAESTGKEGTGLLPVALEAIGEPAVYGNDRFFAYIRLASASGKVTADDEGLERGVAALRQAGQPVVTIQMDDRLDLGQEFFRWEIATATAGAILGINAFDQPNVQESKDNTNRLLDEVRREGRLPREAPSLVDGPLSLYNGGDNDSTAARALARFLAQARPGNYVALMAYLPENPDTDQALQRIRIKLRDGLKLATTLGYGPRFLHSTGQFHKGGPNTGLFLQLTADDARDAPVPDQRYTFGVFKQAQAQGDLEALQRHGRRVLRVHLGSDVMQGLTRLEKSLQPALSSAGQ